jgi:hypothetical protein
VIEKKKRERLNNRLENSCFEDDEAVLSPDPVKARGTVETSVKQRGLNEVLKMRNEEKKTRCTYYELRMDLQGEGSELRLLLSGSVGSGDINWIL